MVKQKATVFTMEKLWQTDRVCIKIEIVTTLSSVNPLGPGVVHNRDGQLFNYHDNRYLIFVNQHPQLVMYFDAFKLLLTWVLYKVH